MTEAPFLTIPRAARGGMAAGGDEGDDRPDGFRWVTVATFSQVPSAQIARLRLESEDIPCVLLNENIIAMDWFLCNATGGIQLQVPDFEAARASELLQRKMPASEEAETEESAPACPSCASVHTEPTFRWWAFMSIFFIGAPIPLFPLRHRCLDCGRRFKLQP